MSWTEMSIKKDLLYEFSKLRQDEKTGRNFLYLFCAILLFFVLIGIFRKKGYWPYLLAFDLLFFMLGSVSKRFLQISYRLWMLFGITLGWFVTRLLLISVFFLVVTPTGIILRIFGKDLLDEKIDKKKTTYWKRYSIRTASISRYEKQF